VSDSSGAHIFIDEVHLEFETYEQAMDWVFAPGRCVSPVTRSPGVVELRGIKGLVVGYLFGSPAPKNLDPDGVQELLDRCKALEPGGGCD
jgi:hypothetical protein